MKPQKLSPFQKLKFYEEREEGLRVLAKMALGLSLVLLYAENISARKALPRLKE